MKKIVTTVLFVLFTTIAFAQLETCVWYFGNQAGLDFNTPEPKILTDGQTGQWENFEQQAAEFEGVASFSDSLGHLLFYTDGHTVWNNQHQIMADDLLGHQSSTESAIIVPWPKNDDKYYIFVVDQHGGALSYSVVDMKLNNGLGEIVDGQKNIIIANPVCEKITAIRHQNNQDIWLFTKSGEDNNILEWKITQEGFLQESLKKFPVSIIDQGNEGMSDEQRKNATGGYMRVSPNGKRIACAITGGFNINNEKKENGELLFCSILEVYDFDPATGIVTSNLIIKDYYANLYGVEFSNDASKLYYSTRLTSSEIGGNGLNLIYQIDLTLPTKSEIENSAIVVGQYVPNDFRNYPGALQLAVNGKIYIADENSDYLCVINNPRERGEDCDFVEKGQYLGGSNHVSKSGLPNFIPTYFLPPNFEITNLCSNDYTFFSCSDNREIETYNWKIYKIDDNSIVAQSNQESFQTMLPKGNYRASLTITDKKFHQEYSDYKIFKIFAPPEFNMPKPPPVCNGQTIEYNLVAVEDCDVWFDDEPEVEYLEISQPKTIVQTATNLLTGCSISKSVDIDFVEPEHFSLGDDIEFCQGDQITLDVELGFEPKSFCWLDTKSTNTSRTFNNQGKFFAQTIDQNNCQWVESIEVNQNPLPKITLPSDTIICENTTRLLDCGVPNAFYKWNTGNTNQIISTDTAGFFKIEVTDKKNCKSTDSITLIFKTLPEISLPPDTVLCESETLPLDVFWPDATQYEWQDLTGTHNYEVSTAGLYSVNVSNTCGSVTKSISVGYRYCGEFIFPNIITPNGDGLNDYFKIKGLENTSGWQMKIYNREGVNVYQSDDYRNNWNANELSDGVYFYMMQKNNQKFTGNVHVYHKKY